MAARPRSGFLPPAVRHRAGHDGPLDLGHGQTCSQPRTVVDLLLLLGAEPGHRVLDVGAGSGWTTALLAELVGPTGSVLGVERIGELASFGSANVAATGMAWARVEPADPTVLGAPDEAPFDRVLVSAEAPLLPDTLVHQLVPGGVLVVPVAGRLRRVVAPSDPGGTASVTSHGHYRFVPLVVDVSRTTLSDHP